jgi:hypothetical protein
MNDERSRIEAAGDFEVTAIAELFHEDDRGHVHQEDVTVRGQLVGDDWRVLEPTDFDGYSYPHQVEMMNALDNAHRIATAEQRAAAEFAAELRETAEILGQWSRLEAVADAGAANDIALAATEVLS